MRGQIGEEFKNALGLDAFLAGSGDVYGKVSQEKNLLPSTFLF